MARDRLRSHCSRRKNKVAAPKTLRAEFLEPRWLLSAGAGLRELAEARAVAAGFSVATTAPTAVNQGPRWPRRPPRRRAA